jgi:N-acetylglucosaminyldiphosphoundecaprenol N-acetyl-beta-D-mannosaminyltransferase
MTIQRILLIQLADIGDLVLSTPAMAALREAHPRAHIALLTSAHTTAVIEGTGLVDEIIPFQRIRYNNTASMFKFSNQQTILALRQGRYDTVILFHHFTLLAGSLKFALIALWSGASRRIGLENGRGWFLTHRLPDLGFGPKHQAQYWLDLVGLIGADPSPRPAVVSEAPYSLPPAHRRVVIHAGSGGFSVARRWEPERFAAVADALHRETGAQIVLVGSEYDNGLQVKTAMQNPDAVVDLTGKTSLAELAGVLRQADLFIGADSGVMHIASAVGVPIVTVFGPSNHAAWGPWTPHSPSAIMRSAPLCSPCSYVGHEVAQRDGCAARTCMVMVEADQVKQAACALLRGEPPPPVRQRRPTQPAFSRRLQILGLPVDAITYPEWLDLIGQWVQDYRRGSGYARQVCTTNPEFAMIAQKDTLFRSILRRADLCVPDGVGMLMASRWLGQPLPERVTGSDGLPIIAERAAREGWRLYLLGAAPGIAEQAANVLQQRYPGLQIAGTYSGSPAPEEEHDIVARINASGADLLFVAYGAPAQDKWIARNLPRLQVAMAMGVGGTFDFIAGVVPRAPQWMRSAGLEWLYRLYLQPSRIGRMTRLPRFALAVLRHRQRGMWLETI